MEKKYEELIALLISISTELITKPNAEAKDLDLATDLLKQAASHKRHLNTLVSQHKN